MLQPRLLCRVLCQSSPSHFPGPTTSHAALPCTPTPSSCSNLHVYNGWCMTCTRAKCSRRLGVEELRQPMAACGGLHISNLMASFSRTHAHTHTCTSTHAHAHAHTHTHVHTHTRTHTRTHAAGHAHGRAGAEGHPAHHLPGQLPAAHARQLLVHARGDPGAPGAA